MYPLTGATGYVGGRLQRRLERDHRICQVLCRDPEALRWRMAAGTEAVKGDLLEPESLGRAFQTWTPRSTRCIRCMLAPGSKLRIGTQPRILLAWPGKPAYSASFISAAWPTVTPYRLICAAVPTQGTFSVPAAFPSSNSGRQS